MGTKKNPGKFDCYANAHQDEPMFVLLGRDGMASLLVGLWAELREKLGESGPQIEDAKQCARDMAKWANSVGKGPKMGEAATAFTEIALKLCESMKKDPELQDSNLRK